MKPSFMQAALVGGLVGGLLSALPLVNAGNVCCCLWVVSGGVVAAYMLQQNQAAPITPADGAVVGLLAGVAGAFVYLIVSIPINVFVGPMERLMLQRLSETMGNMPPEFRQYATRPLAGGLRTILGFLFMLVCGVVFSTLGGLLGAVIFAKKPAQGSAELPPSA